MSLTKEEREQLKEQIIEDVKNRFESSAQTEGHNFVDIILDTFKNPESDKSKSGAWIYDIIIPLETDMSFAIGQINGLTAPFLIVVMEEMIDALRHCFPIESMYASEVNRYLNLLKTPDYDKYTASQLDNSIILKNILRGVK